MKVKINKAQYILDKSLVVKESSNHPLTLFFQKSDHHIGWANLEKMRLAKEIILIERKLVESNWIPVERSTTPLA